MTSNFSSAAIDGLRAARRQQVLELHLHDRGVAAGLGELGLLHDHRVRADHDYVAGAHFLSDLHDWVSAWLGARDCRAHSCKVRLVRSGNDSGKPKIITDRRRTGPALPARSGWAASRSAQAPAVLSLCGQRRPVGRPRRGGSRTVAFRPGVPERLDRLEGCRVEAGAIARQELVQLDAVGVVRLRIDVPDERSSRPLRANERILAADEVEIALPQQAVVGVLVDERNRGHRQRAVGDGLAGLRNVAAGPCVERGGGDALGDEADERRVALDPRVEQRGQRQVRDSRRAWRRARTPAASRRRARAASTHGAWPSRCERSRSPTRSRSRSSPPLLPVNPGKQKWRVSGRRGCGDGRPCAESTHGSADRYSRLIHTGARGASAIAST